MSRLIDISDERFWQILFEEACVEGQQAERIEKELEKIVCFNSDKVVEELEALMEMHMARSEDAAEKGFEKHMILEGGKALAFEQVIEIVKGGVK